MKAHNILVKAFTKVGNQETLIACLKKILPDNPSVDEVELEPEAEGEIFVEPFIIVSSLLEKQSQLNKFLEMLKSGLDEKDIRALSDTLDSRVDDKCNLFIRLSKKAASDGKYTLNDDDPIHVKIKIQAFPAKRETAIESVRGWLK